LKHRFNLPVLLAVFIAIVALTQSGCKENTLINSKVVPVDSVLGVYATELSCITHTYYDDTGVTGLYLQDVSVNQGVGSVSDGFFGTMTGATHFQVIPDNPNDLVYENATIDSAVLVLPYRGYTYGDTTDQSLTQAYQAFFLNEDLVANTLYYSYTTKQIDQTTPLSAPVSVNLYHLKDSVSVNNVNYAPGLRMKLNLPVLLSRLTPALTAARLSSDAPNTAFQSIFKGVCVKVANSLQSTKAYPFFRLDGTKDYGRAGIIVYYHPNGSTSDTATQSYFFDGESCGYFNGVTKSFNHSPVGGLINSTQANDSIIAMQNQPGPCIDVMIPGISSLPAGIINKAELQFTLLPWYNESNFDPITRLYPRRMSNGTYPTGTTAGSLYEILDRYSGSNPFSVIDGRIHSITRNGTEVKVYTVGIPLEIMSSISAKNDTLHLRLTGTQDYVGAFRMVLGGGNHPDPLYKAKLFVVYSKLN
jgi:hypothetical protein